MPVSDDLGLRRPVIQKTCQAKSTHYLHGAPRPKPLFTHARRTFGLPALSFGKRRGSLRPMLLSPVRFAELSHTLACLALLLLTLVHSNHSLLIGYQVFISHCKS